MIPTFETLDRIEYELFLDDLSRRLAEEFQASVYSGRQNLIVSTGNRIAVRNLLALADHVPLDLGMPLRHLILSCSLMNLLPPVIKALLGDPGRTIRMLAKLPA
jgi:hypothetical protein